MYGSMIVPATINIAQKNIIIINKLLIVNILGIRDVELLYNIIVTSEKKQIIINIINGE